MFRLIELSHASVDGLGLEPVGVALSGIGAFVGLGSQCLGTFAKHGFVEEDAKAIEQAAKARVVARRF